MLKFAVIWHEDNDSGVPKHVMGMSELFDTWEKAKAWVDSTIAEDKARAEEAERPELEVYPGEENGMWFTIGNFQTTYYHIQQVIVDTGAKTRERLREAADTIRHIESYISMLGRDDSTRRDVQRMINEYKNPLKEFEVQVVFSPATVMKVMARTAKEAQNIVNSQIDNGTLILSDRHKMGIMKDILENIESVKTLGEVAE